MEAEKFGMFIARCRKDRGLTQKDLAQGLNVTEQAVSRWERGKGFPDIQLLVPLAKNLEISISELMNLEKKQLTKETNFLTNEEMQRMLAEISEMESKNQRANKKLSAACIVITIAVTAAARLSGHASLLAAWILGAFIAVTAAGLYLFISSGKKDSDTRIAGIYIVLGVAATAIILLFMGLQPEIISIMLFIVLCAVSFSG